MKSMQNTMVVENFNSEQDISNRKKNKVKIYKSMIKSDLRKTRQTCVSDDMELLGLQHEWTVFMYVETQYGTII